jgi:DNA-binding CsgD family transcriptional regulator
MKGLADRSPGPEKTVMWQEEYAKLLGSLTQQETELARLTIQEGITGVYELAERLGVTPGRVSQIRRSASEKL